MEQLGTEDRADTGARVPSLDGLRAAAILLVIVGHGLIAHVARDTWLSRLVENAGAVGVSLFFTISGFIITRLLMRERERSGRIYLWRFYARRAVRLWPALWVLVAVTALLGVAGAVSVHTKDIAGAMLFVTDYLPGPHAGVLYHTWSLSVEEQFYLLWPALMLALSAATGRRALIIAVAAAPLVRVASYLVVPSWPAEYQFHDRYDVLATGCLLALYWDDPRLRQFLEERYRAVFVAAGGAVAVVEALNARLTSQAFVLVAGYTIEAVALAAIVGASIAAAGSPVGRVLNARPAVHLGVISYSLYLWQQMFVLTAFGVFQIVPLGVLAALACAELSWRLVERPFLSLRRRLHPPVHAEAGSPVAQPRLSGRSLIRAVRIS